MATSGVIPWCVMATMACPSLAGAQTRLWLHEFESSALDEAAALANDGAGGVFVAGLTTGSLGGPNAGGEDAWLARMTSAGAVLWTRQLGTSAGDWVNAAAPDGRGGCFVAGNTYGALGGPFAGAWDAWLARFAAAGTMMWIRQFGTDRADGANALAADGEGGVYCAGETFASLGGPWQRGGDAWLARYDADGSRLWIRQLGTGFRDGATALAGADALGVFVGGFTQGDLGGPNMGGVDWWVARFDSAGEQAWVAQWGSSDWEELLSLAPDGAGGVFAGGYTTGSLGGPLVGGSDAWLGHVDSAGTLGWLRQFGTADGEATVALASDGAGGIFAAGETSGALGAPNAGEIDAWIGGFDGAGTGAWITQSGGAGRDRAAAAAADGSGGVFVAGSLNSGSQLGTAWVALYAEACYADCDTSTGPGSLDIFDFLCFQNSYEQRDPYACDCDISTGPGDCNVFDFLCFQNAYAAGCP